MSIYPTEVIAGRSIGLPVQGTKTGNTSSPAVRNIQERSFPDAECESLRESGRAPWISTEERRRDIHLVATITQTLEWNRLIPHNAIHVEASGGYVTLTGHAYTYCDREDAGTLAKRAPGVRNVDNRIEVLTDDIVSIRLKSAIADVLLRQTEQVCHGICVEMRSGRVVLTGKVRSIAEKRLLLDTVRWMHHVPAVEDRLEIDRDQG